MKKNFLILFYSMVFVLGGSFFLTTQASLPYHDDIEEYYILQKGFITVQGKTNFFDFAGESLRHEGSLIEEKGTYNGGSSYALRISDLMYQERPLC